MMKKTSGKVKIKERRSRSYNFFLELLKLIHNIQVRQEEEESIIRENIINIKPNINREI